MSDNANEREIRLGKLARLREIGYDPYAVESFPFTETAENLKDTTAQREGEVVPFAGRIVSRREMGKSQFLHLSDGADRFQIYVRKNDIDEAAWEALNLLDLGDHLGVVGSLFITKTGEPSLQVSELKPLSKSLHVVPIPKQRGEEQWYGLTDTNVRFRHRHLDLITNPDARRTLVDRSRIVTAVRRCFNAWGYLEVETPMLQQEAGGAAARTFSAHYNAYDLEVDLRISLELYLKRILCGDIPRVYEIGRVFRNEGVSNRHNPEFTLLEFYEAYADLEVMMQRVEDLFRTVATEVFGSPLARIKRESQEGDIVSEVVAAFSEDEAVLDFGKPWRRVDLLSAIEEHSGLTAEDLSSLENAKAALKNRNVVNPVTGKRINAEEERHLGGFIEKLLEVFVEPHLQEPSFVIGYPLETSPLAKKDPNRPGFTRRFEGYVLGREICNAFSEINDPIDQRERFQAQMAERASGDDEAHPMDEDFLYALESGMPPTGGCGIGMDRMVMLLTGARHIRQVMFFPMMRPEGHAPDED